MWFTDFPLGIGMCMMTDCMHTFSPLIQIDYGGIGALTIFTDPDGASAGDGLHRGIIAVGILLTGMVATGVAIGEVTMAVTGVVTGDLPGIITIIIRTGQATTVSDIQTTARQDIQDILLPDAVRQDLVIPADLQLAHEEGLQVV